jgi:hypothetical protein
MRGGTLPKVPESRRAERAAVNALRGLLDRHGHIVQDIHAENDFGEDLFVTFAENGQVTGDVIKIQVKGGRSWRRISDYGVPVGSHGSTWCEGNVPVFCVVHDPDTDSLYWENATKQLLKARREHKNLRSIAVDPNNLINDQTIADFVEQARRYVSSYRGNQAIRAQLGEMAGVEFGPSDSVLHFINEYGEDLIFWQRRGEGYATLLHSDLDWEEQYISPEDLHADASLGGGLSTPIVGDAIINSSEATWLAACFNVTEWVRKPVLDDEAPATRPEVRANYVAQKIEHRLNIEPDALAKSVDLFREETNTDTEVLAEVAALEADFAVSREIESAPWREMSPEARRLASLYLVRRVIVGEPSLPISKQFDIIWRSKRRWEYGFSARVGKPSIHLTSQREIAEAAELEVGDRIYWLSRFGNERARSVSEVWRSADTPGAVCILFDKLSLADTFWPGEMFARKIRPHR